MKKPSVKTKYLFLAVFFVLYVLPLIVSAQMISSVELIKNAKQYDGKMVVFEGEVIGDIMVRTDHAWVNVNDGDNAIGIWASLPLIKDITHCGSYNSVGDALEITGIFHQACPEHGGDLDIHAQSIRKTAEGRIKIEKINLSKRNTAIVLLGALSTIWILTLLMRK